MQVTWILQVLVKSKHVTVRWYYQQKGKVTQYKFSKLSVSNTQGWIGKPWSGIMNNRLKVVCSKSGPEKGQLVALGLRRLTSPLSNYPAVSSGNPRFSTSATRPVVHVRMTRCFQWRSFYPRWCTVPSALLLLPRPVLRVGATVTDCAER